MNYKTRQPFPHAAYVEGQRNFTYFDRSLTSGLTDEIISSPGDFLYIDQASTGVVSVELNMRQGGTLAPILLAAGGSIECDFASIKLNATAQLGKTLRLIVGNGARIKGGATVNATSEAITTLPGQKLLSASGLAFMGVGYQAAVPGEVSHVQIMNPVGNARNVFVTKIRPGAVAMTISSYSSPLTTLYSNAPSVKIDASASSAQVRIQSAVGTLYTALYGVVQANEDFTPDCPFFLPPGKGLVLAPQAANTLCYPTIEFFEE